MDPDGKPQCWDSQIGPHGVVYDCFKGPDPQSCYASCKKGGEPFLTQGVAACGKTSCYNSKYPQSWNACWDDYCKDTCNVGAARGSAHGLVGRKKVDCKDCVGLIWDPVLMAACALLTTC